MNWNNESKFLKDFKDNSNQIRKEENQQTDKQTNAQSNELTNIGTKTKQTNKQRMNQ